MNDAHEIYRLGQRLERAGNPDREHPDYYAPDEDDSAEPDGAWLVENLYENQIAARIDELIAEVAKAETEFRKLRSAALELVRQAEESLDYRPEFRRAIANVVRDAGKY